MIEISEAASRKILSLVKENQGLRVKIVGGGCSGLQIKMDLDYPTDNDKIFEREDAKVIVDKKSFLFINNSVVDYNEDLMNSGFSVKIFGIKHECGCGKSFSV